MEKNRKFWKSIEQFQDNTIREPQPEFPDVKTVSTEEKQGLSRRKFVALLGASTAFATVACTDYRDKKEIMTYNKKPEEILPGTANYYASSCTGCSLSCGILIKTREGRPIKIDGNPDNPINKGKICNQGQANILNLYDPERLKAPARNSRLLSEKWKDLDDEIISALKKAGSENKEIALICNSITSPTLKLLLDNFKTVYPTTKIYSYEFFDNSNKRAADKETYGTEIQIQYNLSNAKVILALESEFLGNEGNFIENINEFSKTRNVEDLKKFSRLYVVESFLSMTGMNSDYRLRLNPEKQSEFIMSLTSELLGKKISNNIPSEIASKFNSYNLKRFAQQNKMKYEVLEQLVDDLLKNHKESIVIAGSKLSKEAHIAANLLNEILGNKELVNTKHNSVENFPLVSSKEIEQLVSNINSGKVGIVINFDANPCYHFPDESGFAESLKKTILVTLSESSNESTFVSNYVLPINHNFESWGDHYTRTGFISLQQPVIAPLYDTRQKEAILLVWMSGKTDYDEMIYHKFIKTRWENQVYPKVAPASDFESFWYSALHDGIAYIKEPEQELAKFNFSVIDKIKHPNTQNSFTLLIANNYFTGAGKFGRNGWLHELPHPVTKITWDNFAAISPATAKELNVEMENKIEISYKSTKLELPVVVQPGMSDKVVYVELGYGRKHIGEVGSEVGFDAGKFLSYKNELSKWIISGIEVRKVSGKHRLASTQEHHSLDDKFLKDLHKTRQIIREGTVAEYKAKPGFLKEHGEHELISIHSQVEYKGIKWAMAIDLNKCVGCGACVTACNVENNIPVVGKDQVLNGREMHWMRIDRYYSGTPDEPVVSQQPLNCSHCDNAPCENVCPVVATSHSPDGLNQMTYNRCVGTRYCANNCPTKVRRYNFFNFRDHFADGYYNRDSLKLLHNPEVTVRSRSVMEKCTFCIQRITEAKQEANIAGKEFKGTGIMSACQVACPASAITFGNVNDTESEMHKMKKHELGYTLLDELNIKSNVTYIARLRNTNEEHHSEH